jgi:hypothetical protein
MGSDHSSVLLHTEIRWLSRGKSLSRVSELHDELRTFLILQNYFTLLSDESWVAKLAYLSDIFSHLKELNRKMQGKDETIFSTTDKIEGVKGKLKLWLVCLEKGSTEILLNLCSFGGNVTFIPLIVEHLNTLHKKFGEYIQTYSIGFVIPSALSATEASLPLNAGEELVTLRAGRALKTKFSEILLDTFWLPLKSEYPVLSITSVRMLIPFSTTYLCELGLSALNDIKTYKRERLRVIDEEMRVALSAVAP